MACVAGSNRTSDPALIVVETHTVRPDTTMSVVTAAATTATTPNSVAVHRDISVWIRPATSFMAAHPRR